MFFNHNTIRLEIIRKKKTIKKKRKKKKKTQNATKQPTDNWRNQREIKIKNLETKGNEDTTIQNMSFSKSSSKREVYSNTSLPLETRKISNNLTLHLKQLEKE